MIFFLLYRKKTLVFLQSFFFQQRKFGFSSKYLFKQFNFNFHSLFLLLLLNFSFSIDFSKKKNLYKKPFIKQEKIFYCLIFFFIFGVYWFLIFNKKKFNKLRLTKLIRYWWSPNNFWSSCVFMPSISTSIFWMELKLYQTKKKYCK